MLIIETLFSIVTAGCCSWERASWDQSNAFDIELAPLSRERIRHYDNVHSFEQFQLFLLAFWAFGFLLQFGFGPMREKDFGPICEFDFKNIGAHRAHEAESGNGNGPRQ